MVIQHNLTAINAWRQTGINNKSASKSLEKLSSGFKINRAGDDAAGLAISEKMRGQIRGTMMGTQNTDMGINLIQTAEGALNETHAILGRMRELAVQSSNGTYQNEVDRANLEKEYQALKGEVDRIAESTHYNGIKLIDGSQSTKNANQLTILSTSVSTLAGYSPPTGYKSGTLADAGINESYIFIDGRLELLGYANKRIDDSQPSPGAWNVNSGSDIILTWNASASMWDYSATLEARNTISGENYGQITTFVADGSFDPLNPYAITYPDGSKGSIVFYSPDAANRAMSFSFYDDSFYMPASGIQDGTMIVLATESGPGSGTSRFRTTNVFIPDSEYTGPTDPTDPSNPTSPIKPEIGSLIIHYGANKDEELRINIDNMGAAALGIDSTSISGIDLANNSIASLDNATNLVSKERANLGAYQNRLESIARDNGVKTENLQAAEASIHDVDMAKEMMNFTKNNILAQAAQSMLAQANQLPQGVLSLLR